MQNSITQGQIPNKTNVQPMPAYVTPPAAAAPNPNYAGVNIQIFNPMVGTPQGTIYPQQTGSAYASGTQGGCYPAGYYTGQYPAGTFVPQNPYGTPPNGGTYDMNGVYYPPNPNGHPLPGSSTPDGQNGYYDQNGVFHPTPNNGGTPVETGKETSAPKTAGEDSSQSGTAGQDGNNKTGDTASQSGAAGQGTKTDDAAGSGEKQVTDENAAAAGADAASKKDSPTQDKAENDKTVTDKDSKADAQDAKQAENDASAKKTEKRKIVELSDDYIKTLENYLNSQDSEVRLMGAKEVVSRAMEDDSRKDDPALTALVNKMLQDPSSAIRAIALSLVDSRTILGNDYTVNVLKKMQTSKDGFGQDSVQATSALLKMAGKTVEKEFEVKETPKKDKK